MPLHIVREDIGRMKVDAVVAAGSPAMGFARTGRVKLNVAPEQLHQYVISVVWPRWRGGDHGEGAEVEMCCRNVLEHAAKCHIASVAFPLTSGGRDDYPWAKMLRAAVRAIRGFLTENEMEVFLAIGDREPGLADNRTLRDVRAFVSRHYECLFDELRLRREQETVQAPTLQDCCGPDGDTGSRVERAEREAADFAALLEKERQAAERVAALARKHQRALMASAGQEPERPVLSRESSSRAPRPCRETEGAESSALPPELLRRLHQLDEGFRDMLLRLIDERGMTDAECYRRANLDRKLFNKIVNIPDYRPRKPTVVALCIALRLDWAGSCELLARAGYGMSHASRFDVIVEYFITHGEYDLDRINFVLFDYDQPLLGSGERAA